MNGYLECLIDQYENKVRKAMRREERSVYVDVLRDLLKLKQYIDNPELSNVTRKYAVSSFKGNMPGFMEFLKKLNTGEGE